MGEVVDINQWHESRAREKAHRILAMLTPEQRRKFERCVDQIIRKEG